MASIQIHIVIGMEFAKKEKINDFHAFMSGIIEPDFGNTNKTHYSGVRNKKDLREYLANKVDLKKFLLENELDSDYQKGYFLHLITDYKFFNEFFDKKYLDKVSYEDFSKDLYYSYPINNKFLNEHYGLEYFGYEKEILDNIKKSCLEKNMTDEVRTYILDNKKVMKFISDVSNINLEEYRKMVLDC